MISEKTRRKMSESHKGFVPWNKGKKNCYSEEMLKRMGDSHRGKPSPRKGSHHSEESKRKMSAINAGAKNPNWRGGVLNHLRRIFIWKPGHPTADVHGYVRRSHLVAEKALGRHLKLKNGEMVHHMNGNSLDDQNENLLICTRSYHEWLHHKMRRLGIKTLLQTEGGIK